MHAHSKHDTPCGTELSANREIVPETGTIVYQNKYSSQKEKLFGDADNGGSHGAYLFAVAPAPVAASQHNLRLGVFSHIRSDVS